MTHCGWLRLVAISTVTEHRDILTCRGRRPAQILRIQSCYTCSRTLFTYQCTRQSSRSLLTSPISLVWSLLWSLVTVSIIFATTYYIILTHLSIIARNDPSGSQTTIWPHNHLRFKMYMGSYRAALEVYNGIRDHLANYLLGEVALKRLCCSSVRHWPTGHLQDSKKKIGT